MRHKIFADESVNFRIVKNLRKDGFDVISVLERYRSISDKKVLEFAKLHKAILLTEDSDFGEWIFSHKEKDVGVIFLRYKPKDIARIMSSLTAMLNKYNDALSDKFAVIKVTKIRIREM